MRRALLVVGKPPVPGRTKTRLVPPLSADEAALLSRGFLLDSVNLGLSLGWERTTVVHPRGAADAVAAILSRTVNLFEQPGHGLQDALTSAFAAHFAFGFDQVVLIGSDNPTLPADILVQATASLSDHDVVIGPSADGGYYLIGLRQPHPGLFEAIDWSTPRVYAQTVARAARLGLDVASVAEWYDVDEPADLDRLQRDLASRPSAVAAHTRTALQRLAALAVPQA
jgi:rSAM/selenodomain-associated transferase 1